MRQDKQKNQPRKSGKSKKTRSGKFIKYALLFVLLVIVVAGGAVSFYVYKTLSAAPVLNPNELRPVQTTYVYDDQNELYTEFHGEEDRTLIEIEDVPRYLLNAFVAIEDERFWTHPGIDLEAIGRAAWTIAKGGRIEGGSTITQQLLKNSILTPARTIERKLQEQWLAIQLERMYTKEEILEMYLNRVFLGHYAYGIEAASNMYFGKTTAELSLAEAAMLAAVNQSPNALSPYNNFDAAVNRRNLVLLKMTEQGYINAEQAEAAKAEEVVLAGATRKKAQPYPQFTWYMKERAKLALIEAGICSSTQDADAMIFTGGLHIYTTLNQDMQQAVEDTIVEILEGVGEEEPNGTMGPQVAAMIIDPHTGEVKAAVGDRDVTQNGLKRYSQSAVQTGSSIKPILDYGLAIAEKGYTAGTPIDDAPVSYPGWGSSDKPYRPLNYHRRYLGIVPLRTALVQSLNVPAVKTFLDVGIQESIQFAQRMGINNTIYPYPSSALGGSELTLEEMTRAFGVYANAGVLVARKDNNDQWQNLFITKITDSAGNVLYEPHVKQQIVLSEQASYIMTDVLKGVVARYKNAQGVAPWSAAGKTGTSQGSQYTWFVGYTPDYVGGVWVGHDSYPYPPEKENVPPEDRKWLERTGATGSSWPALLWGKMMNNALTVIEAPVKDFVKPAGITAPIAISTKSGLLPNYNTPADFIYEEIFIEGTQPTQKEDLFHSVQICTDSHKLATPNCPADSVVTRLRMVRPTNYDKVDIDGNALDAPYDAVWEMPTLPCDVHNPPPVQEDTVAPENSNPGETEKPTGGQ